MHYTTKNYPTINAFSSAKNNNLIINIVTYFLTILTRHYLIFELRIPRKNIVEDYDIEEAIKFFYEFIFEANADSEGYLKEAFDFEKNYILDKVKNQYQSNMFLNAYEILQSYTDPKEIKNIRKNTFFDILNVCNRQNVLEYNNNIISGEYFTYFYGNFDEDVIKIFDKYFKPSVKKTVKKQSKIKLVELDKYIETTFDFKQTIVFNYYRVQNFNKKDRFYLIFLKNILSSPRTMLVFKKLRIDNNLVYSSNVDIDNKTGEIIISTNCSYENVNKINELIKEVMAGLDDINKLKEYQKIIIDNLKINLIRRKDNYYDEYYRMLDKSLNAITLEKIIKEFTNIDMEEFIKFLKRVEQASTIVIKERD